MAQLRPSFHTHDAAPVLTPVESRQGLISGRVLLILATSLFLAAFAGVSLAIYTGTLTF